MGGRVKSKLRNVMKIGRLGFFAKEFYAKPKILAIRIMGTPSLFFRLIYLLLHIKEFGI